MKASELPSIETTTATDFLDIGVIHADILTECASRNLPRPLVEIEFKRSRAEWALVNVRSGDILEIQVALRAVGYTTFLVQHDAAPERSAIAVCRAVGAGVLVGSPPAAPAPSPVYRASTAYGTKDCRTLDGAMGAVQWFLDCPSLVLTTVTERVWYVSRGQADSLVRVGTINLIQ